MRRKSMSKPSAVITTLEDSAPWLDQRLVLAYLRTTYRCLPPYGGKVFNLRVGQYNDLFDLWLAEEQVRHFAFLTAWNPGSTPLPADENERRNQALEKDLRRRARQVLPGVGIGDDKNYPPEAGFFALNISATEAVALGRAFGQNALVFGQAGGPPELWWLAKP